MEATGNLRSYCSESNFVKALQTISEDISVVGLAPLAKYDGRNPVPVIVSLVNTVWTLLQHRQKLVDSKRDLELKITVLSENFNHSEDKLRKQEKMFHRNKNTLLKEKNMIKLLEQEKSEALAKCKSFKQEAQEQKQQLKSRELQFKFEFRKQLNEIASLQEKLRKILSKERGEKWNDHTVKFSNSKSSEEHSRIACIEDMYKKSINRLENNVQALIRENLELRKLLDNVSSDLAHLLTKTHLDENIDIIEEKPG
uniref:Uncharacterized protein n=1 Tax=Homalodisca liturata TaxID=320908 RepID=A0A1B6HN05_9HEMI